jgi:hypothetical protein
MTDSIVSPSHRQMFVEDGFRTLRPSRLSGSYHCQAKHNPANPPHKVYLRRNREGPVLAYISTCRQTGGE